MYYTEFNELGDERGNLVAIESNEDIPFDIKHLRHIKYEYTPRGMKAFEEKLEQYVAIASAENISNNMING